jgi:hypothetical protein
MDWTDPDSSTETGTDETATGWLSETVATIATEGRSIEAARAPSQEVLEDQPGSLELTGELPTQAFVSGDQKTQEAIADTQDLFGGLGSPFDSDDGDREGVL